MHAGGTHQRMGPMEGGRVTNEKPLRGFALLSPEQRHAISSCGGKASQKVRVFKSKQLVFPGVTDVKSASSKPPRQARRKKPQANNE